MVARGLALDSACTQATTSSALYTHTIATILHKNSVVEEDALVLVLEPLLRLGLLDLVVEADPPLARAPLGDAHAARAAHHHVKVHAVDAGRGVVLEATLEDLLRLLAAHRHVRRDLLVTADAELAHGVARLREERLLARELLEHLGGAGE